MLVMILKEGGWGGGEMAIRYLDKIMYFLFFVRVGLFPPSQDAPLMQ